MLLDDYNGEVLNDWDEFMKLLGVGRKIVNVVVFVVFGILVIVVDIYVEWVSKWLVMCRWKDFVLEVEKILMKKVLMDEWGVIYYCMIFFGCYYCKV